MSDDNFFQDGNTTAEVEVPKVKVGEEEYSQEDLQKLVGLGKIGLEAEEKYKTKIDRVWPNYQQVINEKRELTDRLTATEKRASDAESKAAQNASQTGQMTPEQIRMEALRQAEELGIGPAAIRKTVVEVVQGQELIRQINGVIDNMTDQGLPGTTIDDVIAHMQETGIRNPEKAYKDMFEKEYIDSQAKKLSEIKPKGMPSVAASVAGGKTPAQVKVTSANLDQMISDALSGGEG